MLSDATKLQMEGVEFCDIIKKLRGIVVTKKIIKKTRVLMLRLYILYSSSDVKLRCLYNPRILRLGEFEKS